jgi:ankyrin repeat protein
MANVDVDVKNGENTENAPVSKPAGSKKQAKRMAAAVVVVGVLVILLGVSAWVFWLRPSPDISMNLDNRPLPLSETDRELIQAVRNDNADEAFRLLEVGAKINAMDSSGATAIKAAIALNRVKMVHRFLETNKDPLLFRRDNSLLIYAIIQNRLEITQELLKSGADVNKADRNGCTPLMYAIDRNHATVARSLLRAGADVNRVNRYGETPLMQAATVGRPDMISLLLDAGADPGIVSPVGETAMSIAQRKNRRLVISLLVNAGSPLFY